MSDKKPFTFHVEETRHFEFEVWAATEDEANAIGQKVWREAPTTGQWELPETGTDYTVSSNNQREEK